MTTPRQALNPRSGPIYAGDWSDSAGKPYRPSNGTEGHMFQSMWCEHCERDRAYREDRGDSCPILANALCFDIGHPDYPREWLHDVEGVPLCTAFVPEATSEIPE